ncbi:MAG TPA: Fic family protein [Candidatus Bathyarchaeia archaeon]|nr:Fic family protein [Candidatus Bathyarchaeia archaeon]
MALKFNPLFTITSEIAQNLLVIEQAKTSMAHLPLSVHLLARLQETARLTATHYSTQIEGNLLTQEQVAAVVEHDEHFKGRERDEHEVKGYYAALDTVEKMAKTSKPITEKDIMLLHALVMAAGSTRVTPTPYRDGQNVIRSARSRRIVYMPPEAGDVPSLMKTFVSWIASAKIPSPLVAALAHYQFVTIHPYYDGNGRTARLLTTLILHKGGYDLKGIYSLEEYYARDLPGYYTALTIGPSHNYYEGRAEADLTDWIAYFIHGMALSCTTVIHRAQQLAGKTEADHEQSIRSLNTKQRKILTLFRHHTTISAAQIAKALRIKSRTATQLCTKLMHEGFLVATTDARRGRRYMLTKKYQALVKK